MDGETKLVARIARLIGHARISGARGGPLLRLGIGDDAAIVVPDRRRLTEWVLSCDAFLGGVHFLAKAHPADSVGYKSLARATSDLAAMGATPRLFLLSLALPLSCTGRWLDEFLRGMGRASRLLGLRLAGGDTTKSSTVSISITVLGEVARGRALTRSGARPGDILYVSGRLGRSQLGLQLIRSGCGRDPSLARLLKPHLYPRIRLELGAWLAGSRVASAMLDISDGLSTDIARLCAASGVGARLLASRIPRVSASDAHAAQRRGLKLDPLEMALHGGDDYELLFAVPARRAKRLRSAPGSSALTSIGEITGAKRIVLVGADGRARRLDSRGWDPFRKK